MAAPQGNQFWKLRSKHPRNQLFGSPELLLESAYEYFEWCDKHTWHRQEAVKSGSGMGTIIEIPVARPYSMSGLCAYLGCSPHYFGSLKKRCDKDFLEVLERIENIVETQQFEGAVIGVFNASIIARKLAMREQTDTPPEGTTCIKIEVIDSKTKDELEAFQNKMKRINI